MALKRKYGHLVKYFDSGRNYLFGRLYSPFQLMLTLATYLTVIGITVDVPQIVLFSIALAILMGVAGYYYSKTGLFSSEISARNVETPEVMENLIKTRESLEILRRIEKKMGEKI